MEKLGEGGMGVVYKAEDEKLKRTVALKFVPRETLGEPEVGARFCQEAQAAAALSHPNLCTIYELDEELGFLAMEFLEGETVQARLQKRPLPLPDALDIAMQAAQGLQAAHERAIVHRDIKSSNIMLTLKGGVKIMDFGLARIAGRTRLTQAGSAIGTPAYMSPEQARGGEVGRQSDLWSLGVVLYEMVTGRLPFRGENESTVVHSILHDDPEPVTALRAGIPLELDRIIGKALAKDAGERYQHAEDFLVDMKNLRNRLGQGSTGERSAAARQRRRLALAAALAGLIAGGAATGLWTSWRASPAPAPPVVRFAIDLPPGASFLPTWNAGLEFTPDGSTLGYSHRTAVSAMGTTFLHRLDSLEPRPLAHAPGMTFPNFSPDGQQAVLLDVSRMELKKVALSGGAPVLVAPYDMAFLGEWSPDNYYYWTTHFFGPIVRQPLAGGKEEPVTALDTEKQERTHRHARLLPGGKAIVFTVAAGGMDSYEDARIDAFIPGSKTRKALVQGGFCPRYSPTGHLVYARGGSLYAVPIDPRKVEVTGPPIQVADNVFMSTNTGSAHFTVSSRGALAYAAGPLNGGERTLEWVDRNGKAEPLPLPPKSYLFPRISPDGGQIAFEVEGVNHDLYAYDLARGVTTKLTTDGVSHAPVWTPDGKRIAFRSWKAGTMTMWWMPADHSAPEERLTTAGVARQSLVGFSPDGRFAAFNEMEPGQGSNVYVLPIQGERKPVPMIRSRFGEGSGRFSRDGKWLAYCSNESGRPEVYVQAWPGPGPRIQISSEGGTDPMWSLDGKEMFYRNGDEMMAVPVSTQPVFRAGKPTQLWQARYSHGMSNSCGMPGATSANYDVTPDGKRFLMIKDVDQDAASTRIVVVLNFAEELKRLERERKQ